jgi:uncharacterized protein YqeY
MADTETLQQMKADMKTAMKAREKVKLQTIRTILSSLKNASIDKKGDLDEDDIISVLSTESKKRREAMQAYSEGGREELAEQEEAELRVIEEYLPPQMSDEDAEALVDEAIESTGASSKADMGQVMGFVMPKVKGVYDGSKIKDIVLNKL